MHQPTDRAFVWLDYLDFPFGRWFVSRVDFALDLITATREEADALGKFVAETMLKPWHGKQRLSQYGKTGVRYTSIDKDKASNIIIYSDGETKAHWMQRAVRCAHIEWRACGTDGMRRAGVTRDWDMVGFSSRVLGKAAASCGGRFWQARATLPAAFFRPRLAPTILSQLDYKLRDLKRPVEQVKEASDRVEKLARAGESASTAPARNVVVKPSGILEQIFGTMQTVLIQLCSTLVLLFFLIAAGDMFKIKFVQALRRYSDKKRTVCIWRDVENNVSIYILTIALINTCVGIAIALGLHAIGLPNALLWGAMALLLNFIPYLGALVGLAVITAVSIITFDSLGTAIMAPAIYASCNLIESQLVTPAVLGRRLSLNPVFVFISVIFWGWLWGMPGATMAVPLLIIVHVLCSHIPAVHFLAALLTMKSGDGRA